MILGSDEAYLHAKELITQSTGQSDLYTLDLSNEGLEALEALPTEIADCRYLAHLHLGKTNISDLTPLSQLKNLHELSAESKNINDISPIASLPKLSVIVLENTALDDLSPLRDEHFFVLCFPGSKVRDLEPISGMTGLNILDVSGTPVKDLSPISGMTELADLNINHSLVEDLSPLSNLSRLWQIELNDTPVLDLRPLRSLRNLIDRPSDIGLTFRDCTAAQIDPRIAEISEVDLASSRAQNLFDYLDGWKPPMDSKPAFGPLVPVNFVDGKLEIRPSNPTEAEMDDRVKKVLHSRLQERSTRLAQLAGNEFFLLCDKARALQDRLSVNFEEVDLLNVHLDIAELSRLAERGRDRDGEPTYPQELAHALADVVQDGPGLTLDNPDVEVLEQRKARLRPRSDDEWNTQDHFANTLVVNDETVGENLRALARRTLEDSGSPEARTVQEGIHRNVLIRLGRLALVSSGAVAGAVAIDLAKAPILELILANYTVMLDVAAIYGQWFQTWFAGTISSIPNLSEVTRATLDALKNRGRR